MNIRKTRALYESYCGPNRTQTGGRTAFVNNVRHWLGLCDVDGHDYKDRAGNRRIVEAAADPQEFATDELAQAIIPAETRHLLQDQTLFARALQHRAMVEAQHPGDGRALLEAAGVGVDVSAFADINAWVASVGGLIERRILEQFSNPMFIADQLMPAEPSKVKEGQKVIGAARIGDKGQRRQPGEPHQRAGFGERYVTLPSTRENALAVDVFKEAIFFDLTGQILETAGSTGEWLGYRKELDVIDAFIGVNASTGLSTGEFAFNYKGTAQVTYTTTLLTGYLNQQSNELIDWTSVESSWLLFVRMQDPETSTRILVMPDTVLVNPGKLATANLIRQASRTERRTAGTATQATAATLQVADTPGNPTTDMGFANVLWSPLVEQRCTDASGLNLSQANATKYWWHFQKGKPFRYVQNWPLTVLQAPSNSYDMLDRGIAASYFANERGCPSVWSPWHVVLNTN